MKSKFTRILLAMAFVISVAALAQTGSAALVGKSVHVSLTIVAVTEVNALDQTAGGQPFQLDSKPPSSPLEEYIYAEARYRVLTQSNPAEARELLVLAQKDVRDRWARYEQLTRKDGSHDA